MELRAYALSAFGTPSAMASKPSPLDILLAAMHAHWAAGDYDAAVALATKAAPYVHPRAPAAPPQQDMRHVSDGQLDLLCGLDGRPPGEKNPSSDPSKLPGLG